MCAVLNCRMWALGWVEVCKKNFLCGWLGWGHILPYRQGRHVAMALQAELAAGADVNLGIAVSSLQNPAKVCSGVWRFPWCLMVLMMVLIFAAFCKVLLDGSSIYWLSISSASFQKESKVLQRYAVQVVELENLDFVAKCELSWNWVFRQVFCSTLSVRQWECSMYG